MITVRFQTGICVTYNNGNKLELCDNGAIKILQRDAGQQLWILAMIPAGTNCVIEHVAPCKFENPLEGKTVDSAIRLLTADAHGIRTAPSHFIKKLKLMLNDFNAKTYQWKDAQ